jgi:hypothetical protein
MKKCNACELPLYSPTGIEAIYLSVLYFNTCSGENTMQSPSPSSLQSNTNI